MDSRSYRSFEGIFKNNNCISFYDIVDLDAYELHPGDEKVFNDFINEC